MEDRKLPHKLSLNERRELTMTGVTEVVSFEENAVVLRTALGTLIVQGSGLQLKTLSLDGGQVAVDGQIAALVYEQSREGSLWQRLWVQAWICPAPRVTWWWISAAVPPISPC